MTVWCYRIIIIIIIIIRIVIIVVVVVVVVSEQNVHCMMCWFQALDELDVEEFRHGGANITGFRLVNTTSVLARRARAPTNSFRWKPASESRRTISVFRI